MRDIFCIGPRAGKPPSPDEIGAKAANLARMATMGLPIPPAFVVPVDLCAAVLAADRKAEQELQ